MCPASLPAETSIDVLNLSRRAYNCLRRAGIDTVQQVAAMSDDELLAIQRLGPTVLSEIREKLTPYLDPDSPPGEPLPPEPGPSQAPSERANPPASPGLETPDLTGATVPRPLFPLIEPNVLLRSSHAPLDQIPLERLVLPDSIHRRLQGQGVRSVGELLQQAAAASEQARLISEHMERYLTWLAEQDEAVWVDEVTGRDISPLYRTQLTGETLGALVTGWLSGLRIGRERSSGGVTAWTASG
jgi:hypothetical protein